jgi:hypothetical protein
MSINSSFFASPSGIGPQTGGYNPTPAEALAAQIRQQASLSLMEYALRNDPRVRAMSGLLATGIAGDPEKASELIHKSGTGQILKDISALAVSAGLIPGGSPTELASKVQEMIATQGLTVGGNIGRNGALFGGGAVTDMMSRSVFDSIKNNFYDEVTGLPKKAAHGLDMSEMGQVMGQLNSRGAFRGMDIGDININEDGIYEFKQNEQKMEKVNKIFSDYAAMLKDAKKIFGDLPIAELSQNAERLIGTSLREMGSVGAMRNRIASIQATSAAFGLNSAAVAENMMQMTDGIQRSMYNKAMQDPRVAGQPHLEAITHTAFGRVSANISDTAALGGILAGHSSTAASNAYAEQGKYMPTVDAYAAAIMMAQTMIEVASPRDKLVTGNVLAAQTMLDVGVIKDPKVAEQVQDLITKMGNTGDVDQQAILNQELARLVNSSGADIEGFKAAYTDTAMRNMMSAEGTAKISKFYEDTAYNRLPMEATKQLHMAKQDFGLFGINETGYKNREAFTNLIGAADKQAQDALLTAVGADGAIDEAALDKAYAATPGLSKVLSKEKFKETIKQFATDPNREQGNVKDQISGIFDAARSNPAFTAAGSEREKLLASERAVQSYLASESLGEPLTAEDFGTELIRGFFGAGKVDNNIVLESLKNKDLATSFDIKADKTGISLDAAGVDKLTETLGKEQMAVIAKKLNVNPENREELARALSTTEGFSVLQKNLDGALMGVGKDGKLSIVSGELAEKETKELETQSMVTAAKRLLGEETNVGLQEPTPLFSTAKESRPLFSTPEQLDKLLDKEKQIGGDLSTTEGRAKYHEDIINELTKTTGAGWFSDGTTKLNEFASKFKEEGYSGQEFEALRLMAESNPNIQKAIQDSANKARAEGGEDNMKKYNELMALDRQLQASNSGKFLGVLELMSEGIAQIQLFGK